MTDDSSIAAQELLLELKAAAEDGLPRSRCLAPRLEFSIISQNPEVCGRPDVLVFDCGPLIYCSLENVSRQVRYAPFRKIVSGLTDILGYDGLAGIGRSNGDCAVTVRKGALEWASTYYKRGVFEYCVLKDERPNAWLRFRSVEEAPTHGLLTVTFRLDGTGEQLDCITRLQKYLTDLVAQ